MSLGSNTLFPLVYWYGHADPKRNPQLMERLIRNIGENMDERFDKNNQGNKIGPCGFTTIDRFSQARPRGVSLILLPYFHRDLRLLPKLDNALSKHAWTLSKVNISHSHHVASEDLIPSHSQHHTRRWTRKVERRDEKAL